MTDRGNASSRIAIRFGGSSNSSSSRAPSRPEPSSTNGRRHRAGPALHAGDSSDTEEEDTVGRHETITEFGPDGASSSSSRRDRRRSRSPRDSRRDRKGYRDRSSSRSRSRDRTSSARDTPTMQEDKPKQYGLIINKNPRRLDPTTDTKSTPKGSPPPQPKSADEEALSALLGDHPKPLLTRRTEGSEDDDREPDPEDYSRVPIDDFGAHLLRGFGWDGKMRGAVREVKKHSNLAGLGAKTKGAEELDAWMQKRKAEERGGSRGDKPRRPRADEYRMEEERRKARREERKRESERPVERDYREREREYRDRERGREDRHDRHRDRR